jgi:hypothetical protein
LTVPKRPDKAKTRKELTMSGLLFFGLIIAALVALDYAALRWGIDSRWGFSETRRPGSLSTH